MPRGEGIKFIVHLHFYVLFSEIFAQNFMVSSIPIEYS